MDALRRSIEAEQTKKPAAEDAMITQQAQIIGYIDDYKLLMIATLAVIPLLIVFRQASDGAGKDRAIAME
jgi:MFS transporter, DHA2 family, multidrug resistance protein